MLELHFLENNLAEVQELVNVQADTVTAMKPLSWQSWYDKIVSFSKIAAPVAEVLHLSYSSSIYWVLLMYKLEPHAKMAVGVFLAGLQVFQYLQYLDQL